LFRRILRDEVNEAYNDYLRELQKKIQFVHNDENKSTKACETVSVELEKLRVKAVTKIREFLLRQVQNLRKQSNLQIMQHNVLVQNKFLNHFLLKYSKEHALEGMQRPITKSHTHTHTLTHSLTHSLTH
jgi:vacuolar protein sorting-associated protein 52